MDGYLDYIDSISLLADIVLWLYIKSYHHQ